MTFSVSVLTTLLLFLPGLAILAGVLWGVSHGAVRQTLPATNSLNALAIVLLGSVAAHFGAELILLLQSAVCAASGKCFEVPFNPNLYEAWFGASSASPRPTPSGQVASTVMGLAVLCALSFAIAYKIVAADLAKDDSRFGPLIFGWLSPYVVGGRADTQAITAFVLTKMRTDTLAVGYTGILNEINLSAEKEIKSVTMLACDRFGLKLGAAPSGQRTITLNELLPVVHIPGDEIENIVLKLIELDEAEKARAPRKRPTTKRAAGAQTTAGGRTARRRS